MLALLQRLLPQPKVALPRTDWLEDWAHLRGDELKQVRGQAGFVLANAFHGRAMRIECGRSQRDYIPANELRLRYELGLGKHCEMLLLSRSLAESLEKRTFESLTNHQQTEVTAALPEEARWLALFDRVDLGGLPTPVARQFIAVAGQPALGRQWLEGEMASRLARAAGRWLAADVPLVIMTLRGRLYVRTEAQHLDQALLDGLRGVADAAALSALQLQPRRARGGSKERLAPDAADGYDPERDELRRLDEAMRSVEALSFAEPLPIDRFDLAQTPGAVPHTDAIDGMSVVICDSESLPPITFGESAAGKPEDEDLPETAPEDIEPPSIFRAH